MKCPKCGYVGQTRDEKQSTQCPQCGFLSGGSSLRLAPGQFDHVVVTSVNQTESVGGGNTKAGASSENESDVTKAAAQGSRSARLAECEDCGGTVSRGAVSCPHCGRQFDGGRTPVDVMNIKMSFDAMVWFMVKAALAAIPATIILIVIGVTVLSMLGYGIR